MSEPIMCEWHAAAECRPAMALQQQVRALRAELEADLHLWEPLIEGLDAESSTAALLGLRVASIRATLKQVGQDE